jgi:hypothetical protein
MMKHVVVLGSSLGIILIASCSSGGSAGPDGGTEGGAPSGPEGAMFDGLVLPQGAEQRPDAPVDPTINVPMGGSPSAPQEVKPGGTLGVAIPFTAPNGNIVGAGIRFSPTGPFKFIPIPAAQGKTSGTVSFQMQAPPSLCGSLSSICHSIKCYEFAVTSAGTISRANITDLAVACGNCTEPSCQTLLKSCNLDAGDDGGDAGQCSSVQTAGADAPETRVIQMGKTSGSFNFTYNMYTQMDQMAVIYQGKTLFDTGCVSNGTTKPLTYSGTSSEITIKVTPNCAGGTGTAWDFTVDCPK